jgi:hypothetical protein
LKTANDSQRSRVKSALQAYLIYELEIRQDGRARTNVASVVAERRQQLHLRAALAFLNLATAKRATGGEDAPGDHRAAIATPQNPKESRVARRASSGESGINSGGLAGCPTVPLRVLLLHLAASAT